MRRTRCARLRAGCPCCCLRCGRSRLVDELIQAPSQSRAGRRPSVSAAASQRGAAGGGKRAAVDADTHAVAFQVACADNGLVGDVAMELCGQAIERRLRRVNGPAQWRAARDRRQANPDATPASSDKSAAPAAGLIDGLQDAAQAAAPRRAAPGPVWRRLLACGPRRRPPALTNGSSSAASRPGNC